MPLGGEFQGAAYVVGSSPSMRYSPMSATSTTSIITSSQGRKTKGIRAFASRFIQETSHKIDKAYATMSDNDTSFSQFRKYFRFQQYEPLYAEFPCKFASSQEHMMIGAMYVTPNYLCFTGELLNHRISVILSYADIEAIEEGVATLTERYKMIPNIILASTTLSKPNALLIQDTHGKIHRLFSFNDTVKAWQTIFGIWLDSPLRLERMKHREENLQITTSAETSSINPVTAPSVTPIRYGQRTMQTLYRYTQTTSEQNPVLPIESVQPQNSAPGAYRRI
jgi:hypothetical protein